MAAKKKNSTTKKKSDKPTKRSRRRTDTKPAAPKRYKSFRLEKKITVDSSGLPSVLTLAREAMRLLAQDKKISLAIVAIYGLVYFLFLRAVSGFSVVDTQAFLEAVFEPSPVYTNLTVSALVLSTSFGVEVGFVGALGLVATIVASMALVYAFRQLLAGKKASIRDAYYFGAEQIVPFSLIVFLIVAQTVPFAAGAILLSNVVQSDIIVGLGEYMVFIAIWFFLGLLSAYWLANSLMSLYAVSLPKMYPLKALQATAEIIDHRRFVIFRKILFILFFVLLLNIFLILLAVWLRPDSSFIARDIAAIISLPIFHGYMFTLYRALI